MCVPRDILFGNRRLRTPALFASYRLGDMPSAGLRFLPWDVTRTEALLINAYDFTRPKFRRLLDSGWTLQDGLQSGDRPVLIDSGAYYFLRRERIDLDPKAILQLQKRTGADVAVVLDHPFAPEATDRALRIQQTLWNTELAFQMAGELQLSLMPVVHGVDDHELQECVNQIRTLADRYGVNLRYVGIGSLAPAARRGNGRHAVRVIQTTRCLLPEVHLHCFSMGSALNMLLAFAAGADSVDSQSWMVSAGLKLAQLPGRYVCRMSPRDYMSHDAFRHALHSFATHLQRLWEEEGFTVCDWDTGEPLALHTLADCLAYAESLVDERSNEHVHRRACNNLWSYNYEVQQVRQAIESDQLEKFLENRLKGTRYYKIILERRK